jgi:hypothetical protein
MRFDPGRIFVCFFSMVTYRSPDRFARVTAHDQKFSRHAR